MADALEIDPCWCYYSASADSLINVCSGCPFRPYVSLRLPASDLEGQAVRVDVHRIVFTTLSHDQGWSDNTQHHGTYSESCTMHDAHVSEPSGRDRVHLRIIQSNVHALNHFKKHVNCWDFRDSRGEIGWLSGIQSGDRIQLVPKAYFPGWTNFIKEARIEVWATVELVERLDLSFHRQPSFSIYQQLRYEGKEIRLVVIEPANSFDDQIQLNVHCISLNNSENTRYDALSYFWGPISDLETIMTTVGTSTGAGTPVEVTKNLFGALKHLRNAKSQRTFWIDFLCINQSDNIERNQQVTLMGEIYDSADNVYVWLGEEDRHISDDLRLMREVEQHYPKTPRPFDIIIDISEEKVSAISTVVSQVKLTHISLRHDDSPGYNTNLWALFGKPWFERVWVLQEVWSRPHGSHKSVKVLCGRIETP